MKCLVCSRIKKILMVFIALLLIPLSIPAQEPEKSDHKGAPDLFIGLITGFIYHFGKETAPDAVSGASIVNRDKAVSDPGFASGLLIDAGFYDIGPGSLGLETKLLFSVPRFYIDLGFTPRYRMHFPFEGKNLRAADPFIGAGLWLIFDNRTPHDVFILAPSFTFGCDLEVFTPGLFLGLGIDINTVDLLPVRYSETAGGTSYRYERRMDSVTGLIRVSYKLF